MLFDFLHLEKRVREQSYWIVTLSKWMYVIDIQIIKCFWQNLHDI